MSSTSYKDAGRRFTVEDADARIRRDADLTAFEPDGAGGFKKIPKGTSVTVDAIKVMPGGSTARIVFAHAVGTNGTPLGWTSSRNFKGKFINETLGEIPPPDGSGRFGPNAAWSAGAFLGQRILVEIVDSRLEIERIALDTLAAYQGLCAAAAAAGVTIAINSGFRSYPEQKALFDLHARDPRRHAAAARPGFSKHQNGIAFDIPVAGSSDGNPIYDWLKRNAPGMGFVRTVSGEPWHWEFDPTKAAKAVANRTFKTPNVRD